MPPAVANEGATQIGPQFAHVRFEPSGWTGKIPYAKSIMDYIVRWLGNRFLGPDYALNSEAGETGMMRKTEPEPQQVLEFEKRTAESVVCSECGSLMVPNGSCYQCENCGGDKRV